jgi:hypothetical protein
LVDEIKGIARALRGHCKVLFFNYYEFSQPFELAGEWTADGGVGEKHINQQELGGGRGEGR